MPVHRLGHPEDQPPRKKRGVTYGHNRERQVKKVYEADGWFVLRSPASQGVADLIAIKPGPNGYCRVLMIEVKANAGSPFKSFGPDDRAELISAACASGATPLLIHWPPRGKLREIRVSDWPGEQAA